MEYQFRLLEFDNLFLHFDRFWLEVLVTAITMSVYSTYRFLLTVSNIISSQPLMIQVLSWKTRVSISVRCVFVIYYIFA